MAAQSVTIKLTLPYAMRPEEVASIRPKTPEAFAREISEMFIGRALVNQHGQELDKAAARMFASVKRELDKLEDTITLNGVQWAWFVELFLSTKADEIKVPPPHVVWWVEWLDALEATRDAAKAEAS